MEKRLAFRYGRALVWYRFALFAIVFAAYGFLLAVSPSFPGILAIVLGAVLGIATIIFALSPGFTEHWLTRSRLILRQGWYFRAILPLAEIEGVRPAEDFSRLRAPLGVHRPLGQPTLYVTGGRTGLVVVRLREPQRFWQSFGLRASEIVFDLIDRDAFLMALGDRQRLLAPVQSYRPDPDLRD